MASFEMEKKVQFGLLDFVVFGVMLLLSAGIGIYHAFTGGKQRTTKEFLFANRGMMAIPVALSLLASFMSAITILGVPSEMYSYGTQYWLIVASYIILFPCVALVFVPVFRAVEISSSYEVSQEFSTSCIQTNIDHLHKSCFQFCHFLSFDLVLVILFLNRWQKFSDFFLTVSMTFFICLIHVVGLSLIKVHKSFHRTKMLSITVCYYESKS